MTETLQTKRPTSIASPATRGTAEPVVSVIIPMYNESENAEHTLKQLADAFQLIEADFELIPVDDGSADGTGEVLRQLAAANPRIRPVSYASNRGRGYAIRRGFAAARGHILCSTDADLSYAPEYVPAMAQALLDDPEFDFVVGSPYMAGGGAEGVPWFRLAVSKWGNRILSAAMPGEIRTITGVLRAYRRTVIKSLELESDGKELHPEILAKAHAAGFKGLEIPAVLTRRKKGKSKFHFRATAWSHLLFSWHEKPMLLFGAIGLFVILAGLVVGGFLAAEWLSGTLNPSRPLMTIFPLLLIGGLQIVLFGFLGSQLVALKRELYKIQRENRQLADRLETNNPADRDSCA